VEGWRDRDLVELTTTVRRLAVDSDR
jgi:hypothetical protein